MATPQEQARLLVQLGAKLIEMKNGKMVNR